MTGSLISTARSGPPPTVMYSCTSLPPSTSLPPPHLLLSPPLTSLSPPPTFHQEFTKHDREPNKYRKVWTATNARTNTPYRCDVGHERFLAAEVSAHVFFSSDIAVRNDGTSLAELVFFSPEIAVSNVGTSLAELVDAAVQTAAIDTRRSLYKTAAIDTRRSLYKVGSAVCVCLTCTLLGNMRRASQYQWAAELVEVAVQTAAIDTRRSLYKSAAIP
ncbi:unnamed protein product [Closterium sp. Naga37s-1]|nr:unnamed protein product [Closterium sp. Naga37s-1]